MLLSPPGDIVICHNNNDNNNTKIKKYKKYNIKYKNKI